MKGIALLLVLGQFALLPLLDLFCLTAGSTFGLRRNCVNCGRLIAERAERGRLQKFCPLSS